MDIITVARRSLVDVVDARRVRDVASSGPSTPIVVDRMKFDARRRGRRFESDRADGRRASARDASRRVRARASTARRRVSTVRDAARRTPTRRRRRI